MVAGDLERLVELPIRVEVAEDLCKDHYLVVHLVVVQVLEVQEAAGHFVGDLVVGLVEKLGVGIDWEDRVASEYSEELEVDLHSLHSIQKILVVVQNPSYHAEEDPDSPAEPLYEVAINKIKQLLLNLYKTLYFQVFTGKI